MRVLILRSMKDRQNGPKQCVPGLCENNIFSVFSETLAPNWVLGLRRVPGCPRFGSGRPIGITTKQTTHLETALIRAKM